MDGSEFLGDLEGSQGSLLSCSPSATSLDIDGWFSYLAAQEGIAACLTPPPTQIKHEIHGKLFAEIWRVVITLFYDI
jgi:hypothetical protein